jgi:hypothetical protein
VPVGGLISATGLDAGVYRDNDTWLLGPLGPAAGARSWRWVQVHADEGVQPSNRPVAQFHHTLMRVPALRTSGGADSMWVVSGHDKRIQPVCDIACVCLDADVASLLASDAAGSSGSGQPLAVDRATGSGEAVDDLAHGVGALSAAAGRLDGVVKWHFPRWSVAGVGSVGVPSASSRQRHPFPPRAHHASAFWPRGRRLLVAGGTADHDRYLADGYALPIDGCVSTDSGCPPQPVERLPPLPTGRALATLTVCGDRLLMAGGVAHHSRPNQSFAEHDPPLLVLDCWRGHSASRPRNSGYRSGSRLARLGASRGWRP